MVCAGMTCPALKLVTSNSDSSLWTECQKSAYCSQTLSASRRCLPTRLPNIWSGCLTICLAGLTTCVQRTTVRKSVHSVRDEIKKVPCQLAFVWFEGTLLKIQKCCLSAQPSFLVLKELTFWSQLFCRFVPTFTRLFPMVPETGAILSLRCSTKYVSVQIKLSWLHKVENGGSLVEIEPIVILLWWHIRLGFSSRTDSYVVSVVPPVQYKYTVSP